MCDQAAFPTGLSVLSDKCAHERSNPRTASGQWLKTFCFILTSTKIQRPCPSHTIQSADLTGDGEIQNQMKAEHQRDPCDAMMTEI